MRIFTAVYNSVDPRFVYAGPWNSNFTQPPTKQEPIHPKVSILIPCYNAEKWVAQAIDSALDQTYLNKEIIVVDDGSTDRSPEIIKSFKGRVIWKTAPHRGANATRNRLLDLSRGGWLQYLDADDYLLPDKINNQVEFLKGSKSNTDIIYSPVLLETGGRLRVLEMPGSADFILNFLDWGSIQTGGLLLRKNALEEVGRWREDQPCCQEHELLLRFIKADKKFLYCDKTGAVYRYWNYSSVSRSDTKLVINEIVKILDEMRLYLISKGLWKLTYESASSRKKFECARTIYNENPTFAMRIIRQIKKDNRKFFPSGPAAPLLYSLCYRLFGFSGAEEIARFMRRFK